MHDLVISNNGDVSLPARKIEGAIERVITAIPAPRTRPMPHPDHEAAQIAQLTRTHMLYCLFRHAASHVLRDVAVRTGERLIVRQVSASALSSLLNSVGISVTQRIIGTAAGRWVPIVGAVAVGGYAYWDTMQVAKTARRLLATLASTD